MRRLAPTAGLLVLGALLLLAVTGCGGTARARRVPPSLFGHVLKPGPPLVIPDHSLAARERRAIRLLLARHPVIAHGGRARREVALTFDDGPGPYTARILRLLQRRHVPATFFVVGQMIGFFKPALEAERRARAAIGDHTVGHVELTAYGAAGQRAQIAPVARYLGARLFRPPYRLYDARTVRIARSLGLLTILWDVDSDDWARPGVPTIVGNVLGAVKPGSIVGMHDAGGDRTQTLAALPSIITQLRCRGYRLVTVPRLLADDPPGSRAPLRSGHAHRAQRRRAHGCGGRSHRRAHAPRARAHPARGARAGGGRRVGSGH
jgi:peptidoglycan-N-acetylglucosamine deacetylase